MLIARKLAALRSGGGGGGGGGGPVLASLNLGSNMIEHYDYYFSSPFADRLVGAPNDSGLFSIPSAFSTTTTQVPSANLSSDYWAVSNPGGAYGFQRSFTLVGGKNYTMTWQGDFLSSGDMFFTTGVTRNSYDPVGRTATFTCNGTAGDEATIYLFHYAINTSTPAHNIQITQDDAAKTGVFETGFITELARYHGARFMKWNRAVEINLGNQAAWGGGTKAAPNYVLTWAKRSTPTGGSWWGGSDLATLTMDGVPVEHQVAAANNASLTFAWFCMPWLASDDYITNFATYVRDNCNCSLIYVEEANEVWNGTYNVEVQCLNEAQPPISTLTHVTTTATCTTTYAHGLSTGDTVTLGGFSLTQYNVTNASITVTGNSTFTFTMASDPGANATVTNQRVSSSRYPVQGGDGSTTKVLRYLEQANRCMRLWTDAFAAAPGGSKVAKLRRVIGAQHVQSGGAGVSQMTSSLSYANAQGWLTYNSVPLFDCLTTAPYFYSASNGAGYTGAVAPFLADCQATMDSTINPVAASFAALAATYSLSYIGYEGCFGHNLTDLPTLTAIKTDAGMYTTYLYYFQELHRNGMSLLQTFNFCQKNDASGGIYGHIFPTRKSMPAITKTTLPGLKAIVDYQASVRLLYDCTLKNGSLSFHLNDPDGTVGGQLDKFVEDADYTLSGAGATYFTIDNTTKQIEVKPGVAGNLPAGSYSCDIVATPKTGVTEANGLSSKTTTFTATVASYSMFAARYIKWNVTADDGSPNHDLQVGELEIATSAGGADVATIATASGPAAFGAHTINLLNDGSSSTFYQTLTPASGPWPIVLDFGTNSANWPRIAEYRVLGGITAGQTSASPNSWTLAISTDNVTYTTISTKTGETGWTLSQKRTYPV
jgi:hypothetical protein